jgi:hypothetical protein
MHRSAAVAAVCCVLVVGAYRRTRPYRRYVSTAIRLFLRSVVEKGGLPMEMPRPNPTTLAAIREAKAGKTTHTTIEEL